VRLDVRVLRRTEAQRLHRGGASAGRLRCGCGRGWWCRW
jgi:hypothetical protein